MKSAGDTKKLTVAQMKKSNVIDRQIYCTVRKDLFRLVLDIDGEYTKTTGSIHPSTVLFRGE